MRVGFVHGVMNTDNMSILGLTIDYGPYGWLEPFDLDWTPNITDASGRRYRFGNQPPVAHWNLAPARARARADRRRSRAAAPDASMRFPAEFSSLYRHTMLRKLGLRAARRRRPTTTSCSTTLGALLVDVETDMTLFFRRLARSLADAERRRRCATRTTRELVRRCTATARDWLARYASACASSASTTPSARARMDAVNPLYVPRNYLVQQVIEATERGDRARAAGAARRAAPAVRRAAGRERFAAKRPEWARHKPGCSMLSCSS